MRKADLQRESDRLREEVKGLEAVLTRFQDVEPEGGDALYRIRVRVVGVGSFSEPAIECVAVRLYGYERVVAERNPTYFPGGMTGLSEMPAQVIVAVGGMKALVESWRDGADWPWSEMWASRLAPRERAT